MRAAESRKGSGPLVSIGLPVYNGGDFLVDSLASLLGQSYRNIELIISDNASTDGTERLCRDAAAADSRVHYHRLEHNVGGVANHTRVAGLARGEFFMWAASDDRWARDYVERCLGILQDDPQVVLVYAVNTNIDELGHHVRDIPPGPRLDVASPVARFAVLTDIHAPIEPFYGLMRRDALMRAGSLVRHPGFDRIVLAELALMGRLRQVPEPLYERRIHRQQSVNEYPSLRSRYLWINPGRNPRLVWPHFSYAWHFTRCALRSAPGFRARMGCIWHMLRWCNWFRRELWEDLSGAG